MFRTAAVLLLAAGPAAAADPPDFERHVVGLLGRSGCSAGACHGSFQGKGGLAALACSATTPAKDYQALTRGGGGRRLDRGRAPTAA